MVACRGAARCGGEEVGSAVPGRGGARTRRIRVLLVLEVRGRGAGSTATCRRLAREDTAAWLQEGVDEHFAKNPPGSNSFIYFNSFSFLFSNLSN